MPGADVYWQPARHPRAGIAVGLAILAAWVAAVVFAFASDASTSDDRRAPTSAPHYHAAPSQEATRDGD